MELLVRTPKEACDLLLRYVYLGTDQPFYIHKNKPLDFNVGWEIMGRIQAVPDSENKPDPEPKDDEKEAKEGKKETKRGKKKAKDDRKATNDGEKKAKDAKKPTKEGEGAPAEKAQFSDELVDAIVGALTSGNLVRHDECLFALAYLVRTYTNPEAKTNIYDKVPDAIKTSKDLFQFVYFCQAINQKYKQTEKPEVSFGNGMKRAIRKWYDKQDKLEDLLAMDRGWYKWCHKDLIKMAHVKLEDEDKMRVLDAVCGGAGEKWPTKEEILGKPKADAASGEAASIEAAAPAVAQTKEQLREAARLAKEIADSDQQAAMEAAKAHADAVQAREANASVADKADIHADKAKIAAISAEAARKAAQKVAEAFGAKKVKKPAKNPIDVEKAVAAPIDMAEAPATPIDSEDKKEAAAALVIAGRVAAARIAEAQIADARIAAAQPAEALEAYRRIKEFKRLETVDAAVQQLRTNSYPLQLVPAQLHSAQEIWTRLLPDMPYRDVVQAVLVLQDYKLLANKDSAIHRAYSARLNSLASVEQSKICPIFVYQVMRLYEERQRYLNVVKEAIHATKVLSLDGGVVVEDGMLERFRTVLNGSLSNYNSSKTKYMVTLDLRSQYNKKRVFGNRLMSCMAAHALLILPILKSARATKIFKFTPDATFLDQVDISRNADFFDAFDKLMESLGKGSTEDSKKDTKRVSKKKSTKVEITRPLRHAETKQENVDVFITIVDSLIRVNPKGSSPADMLEEYNKKKNAKARYIIINLCRHKQDLNAVNVRSGRGVLEVAGCPEEIFKVISAFVEGKFS